MDDTSNWELAAAVAAISIGLGGLLIFTIVGTIGSWRIVDRVNRVAEEASQASLAVQDLARKVAQRDAMFAVAPAPMTSPSPSPSPIEAPSLPAEAPPLQTPPPQAPTLEAPPSPPAALEPPRRIEPVQDMEITRPQPPSSPPADPPEVSRLRRDTEMLLEQQGILQDAVRQLIDTGVLRSQGANTEEIRGLQLAVRRIDEQLSRIAEAVSQLEEPI